MAVAENILSKTEIDRQFEERRVSERISASVALRVAVLKPTQQDLYLNTFDELRRRFLMSVEYNRLMLVGRKALKDARMPQGELAVFAETVELRMEMLASLSGLATHSVSLQARQDIMISESGIKFPHPENIEPNTMICLRMASYSSPILALFALANVVHSSVERDNDTGAHVGVAAKFEKIHADDRQQLKSFVSLRESQLQLAA
ncbi:hypothetical protein AB833_07080 [Chromatiales bacterium (ex Bugula neritina AB1)]|nr:hypothetical protein AB833_07080 [Chromatiales bacterium (ex Bugula neritina AB1)]